MTGVVPGRRDGSKSIKVVTGINNTLDMKLHEVIIVVQFPIMKM